MNIAVAILGLAILILIHEAGHFFVARGVGMSPRRFYLGFPPALVKVRRKGIEYGIGAIPLGGYVKIPGMHRPAASDVDVQLAPALKENPSLFPKAARVQRALERGDLNSARADLPELQRAVSESELSPAAARAAQRCVDELRDGLGEDAYWRQRTWKRIAVIFAGPGANILVAIVLVFAAYMIGVPGDTNTTVKRVENGSPAQAMGLKAGDTIVSVNTQQTPTFDDVSHAIKSSNGALTSLTVLRGEKAKMLGPVRPEKLKGRYILGFEPGWDTKRYAVGGALAHSFDDNWRATRATFTFLPRLVTSSGRKQVSGPTGIVDVSQQVVSVSFSWYLWVTGLVSLSLALLNLLPLLPLDGGHILFSIVEGLRGRAVGREIYERVSAIGIALFLVLAFIGLSNDINRLGGG